MKINPINFKYINFFKNGNEKRQKLPSLSFDSFSKVAFKGNEEKFIPAQSLEEAIEYGKTNFKIKDYKNFKDSDLDTLNWFNEGLFNLKKIMKNSVFIPPDKIICLSALSHDSLIEVNGSGFWFSKKGFDDDIEFMKRHILNSDLTEEEKKEKLSSNLTYLSQEYDMQCDGEFVLKSPYSLVYHEMGHIQHQNNVGNKIFKQFMRSPKSRLPESTQELINLFNKNKKTVASKVSEYATENLMEFVAETFAGLCEGVKYSDKVISLYLKLGGVMP